MRGVGQTTEDLIMHHPAHSAARRRARAVAIAATQDNRVPLLSGLLLLGVVCGLMALLG